MQSRREPRMSALVRESCAAESIWHRHAPVPDQHPKETSDATSYERSRTFGVGANLRFERGPGAVQVNQSGFESSWQGDASCRSTVSECMGTGARSHLALVGER